MRKAHVKTLVSQLSAIVAERDREDRESGRTENLVYPDYALLACDQMIEWLKEYPNSFISLQEFCGYYWSHDLYKCACLFTHDVRNELFWIGGSNE